MKDRPKFAICVKNEGYQAFLQLRKVYRVLPDAKGARHKMMRVIDESGEDYLFSAKYFVPVELPQEAESALLALS